MLGYCRADATILITDSGSVNAEAGTENELSAVSLNLMNQPMEANTTLYCRIVSKIGAVDPLMRTRFKNLTFIRAVLVAALSGADEARVTKASIRALCWNG